MTNRALPNLFDHPLPELRAFPTEALYFICSGHYGSLTDITLRESTIMSNFLNWRDFEGSQAEKFYKTTLWQGNYMMVGVNCLEPNQVQPVHAHNGADKFYFVLSGVGQFSVGQEEKVVAAGSVVIAPAGIPHGVTNTGDERLSLLVTIAPGIK